MRDAPSDPSSSRRRIPAVHHVLTAYRAAGGTFTDLVAVPLIRTSLERFRHPETPGISSADIVQTSVEHLLAAERPELRPVLNGTGVILHTNLGRAPVSEATAQAMAAAAASTVALEIDPETGSRGKRMAEIEWLLRGLTGAEAALVVNNNAAAILLVLSTLAAGREVILSRGEAVEIGGGVRIPEVLAQSGATMVEVGTTNRTYAADYAHAIGLRSAAILKVHPSNFRMDGFVHRASIAELAPIAREREVLLIEDQGSGLLIDPEPFGLAGDRPISESLSAGADIVTASGDKLIGGPQAGLILGRADLVERCARHPLARAVRADKVTLAGTAETLRHYARGEAVPEIPIWRMIAAPVEELQARAEAIAAGLAESGHSWLVTPSTATVGGGALPGSMLPSIALALSRQSGMPLDHLATTLRTGDPAVYARIENDHLLVDLRSILPEHDPLLTERLRRLP
jgi:L-seryl-tRNA(Ser) seleniumtransferase